MKQSDALAKANNIIEMFWHNFLKAEPAFVMRDVIAIALENAGNQTELPRERVSLEGSTHSSELLPSEVAAGKYSGRSEAARS